MPFCFLIQNFAEVGQSVDELWPKKIDFQDFGCRHFEVPNFIKIGRFLSRVSILTRDIDIANLSVYPSVRTSVCLSVCLSVTFRYQMKTA